MKVALVHELLTMRGGAERVLKILAEMFPDAPIYTLLFDERKLGDWFPHERVRVSTLAGNNWALPRSVRYNHHLYLSEFPHAVERWDFSEFDLVISTSSAFVHGIITNGKPKHLCIVNSPARYLWDRTHDVLDQAGKGLFGPIKRWYLGRRFHRLRMWDSETAERPDALLAASNEVKRRVELYWRRQSDVVYPPLDDRWFAANHNPLPTTRSPYYLIVSTLVRYKRIDLAIEACNQSKRKLIVVGEGPDASRLKRLAGSTVEFVGYQPHERVRELYANARATVFPGEEDFGLVPLESMSCGTPVIAYGKGGALETVLSGTTGEFFAEPTAQSLIATLDAFEKKSYDRAACIARAKEFSRARFENAIKKHVDALMKH